MFAFMYGLIVKLQGKQRDNLCDFFILGSKIQEKAAGACQ